MTIDQAISKAYLKATRKQVATPSTGLDAAKYAGFLAEADSLVKEWQEVTSWRSLRSSAFSLGAVTAKASFDLDDSIDEISNQENDFIRITKGSSIWNYDLVDHKRFNDYDGVTGSSTVCAVVDATLTFSNAFKATSPQIGGTLTVPAYLNVDDVTSGAQTVQVDDPMWLVDRLAAFYVLNDKVRQFMYSDFFGQSVDKLKEMVRRNERSQLTDIPNEFDMTAMGATV